MRLPEKYRFREVVIDVIRKFFKEKGFFEAQTPILVPVPSAESNLEVFETKLKTAGGVTRRGFLIMSPEYSLKKLIAAGIGSCFEITKCFRNEEEVSMTHNFEFTMLEWYRVGADYRKVMEDFENLFLEIITEVSKGVDTHKWQYRGETYDISLPWPRMSVAEAFEKYCGIDVETLLDEKRLKEWAVKKGYVIDDATTWEQVFYQIMFNEIEPEWKKSMRPVIVYDFPASQAALARKKADDPRFAERFEVFLAGLELGNCFSELTDPVEQRSRFEEDLACRKKLGKIEYGIDEEFIAALKSGMPETSGIAVGVDRLIMLAADAENISDTLFFPSKDLFDLDVENRLK